MFGSDLKRMRKQLDELVSFKDQGFINDLGHGIYKLRLHISGKPSSKSYGARVIFLLIQVDSEIWYLTCYDKSDSEDITPHEAKDIIKLVDQIRSISSREKRLAKFGSTTLGKRQRFK